MYDQDDDARFRSNPISTVQERLKAGTLSTDSDFVTNLRVDHDKYMSDPRARGKARTASDKAFEDFVFLLGRWIKRTFFAALALGALALAGVVLVNANRIWGRDDPLHGGAGRVLARAALATVPVEVQEEPKTFEQLAAGVHGGLDTLVGKHLLKLNPAQADAYAELAYGCALDDACWERAHSSPAREGLGILAGRGIGRRVAGPGAGSAQLALARLRVYEGDEPAGFMLGIVEELRRKRPDDAATVRLAARVQGSWLLNLVAWGEVQARQNPSQR